MMVMTVSDIHLCLPGNQHSNECYCSYTTPKSEFKTI